MTFFYPLSYTQKLEEKIMKNFILKIIGLVVVLLTLTACGGGNVNMVKTGTFNDYQGTTVGDAFDNWDICSSTSWDEFETDNGRNIVEYNCVVERTGYGGMIEFISNVDADEVYNIVCLTNLLQGIECNFSVQRYVQALKDGITFVVQFQVNLDDTFEITYLGASSPKVGEINLWEYDLLTPVDFLDFVMFNDSSINTAGADGPVDILVTNLATYGN